MPVRHRTRLPAPRSPSDGIRCGPSTTGEHFSGVGQRPVSNWAIAALSVEPPVTAAASATGDSNPMFVRRLVPLLFSHRQDSSPPTTPLDRRVLVATEFVFAGGVFGSGVDWSITTGHRATMFCAGSWSGVVLVCGTWILMVIPGSGRLP